VHGVGCRVLGNMRVGVVAKDARSRVSLRRSIVTTPILSLVKQLVHGTNYKTKMIQNLKGYSNEVSFYNLYQNELLYKT
jgi:hypothetical protein